MAGPSETVSRKLRSTKMQGALTYARPKDKEAKGASEVVVIFSPIIIFGCNLDERSNAIGYVWGETHDFLRQLGNDVAEGSQSTARNCESAVRVCIKRFSVNPSDGDAGHGCKSRMMATRDVK